MKAQLAGIATWTTERGDGIAFHKAVDTPIGAYTIVGYVGEPMVLEGKYHPDQHWFSFMQGTILRNPPGQFYDADRPNKTRIGRERIKMWEEQPAKIPHRWEKMYHFEEGQRVLPFDEYKYIEYNSDLVKVIEFWDKIPGKYSKRDQLADIHKYQFDVARDRFHTWARQTLRGQYHLVGSTAMFQYASDAVAAKFRFHGRNETMELADDGIEVAA